MLMHLSIWQVVFNQFHPLFLNFHLAVKSKESLSQTMRRGCMLFLSNYLFHLNKLLSTFIINTALCQMNAYIVCPI